MDGDKLFDDVMDVRATEYRSWNFEKMIGDEKIRDDVRKFENLETGKNTGLASKISIF